MTIIAAIIVFFFVILFHEAGHFVAAKSVGIRVNEFSIGMGPALFQKQKGETVYSIRAIPLGGYCAMEGEDEASNEAGSFQQAKPWQRFVTVLAGPLMNIVIAYLCFSIFLGMRGVPVPVVDSFSDVSPAQEAGMQVGDRITAINGETINSAEELTDSVQKLGSQEKALKVTVLRHDKSENFTVRPMVQEGRQLLGVMLGREANFWASIPEAWTLLWDTFFSLFTVLGQLFGGALSLDAVSGPIGVVTAIGEAAEQGIAPVFFLTGYISVNLAFFNLLPIPALDGFTLLFIIIEKLRGKPLSVEVEGRIKMVGFTLLMALILFISFKDIQKLL